MECVLCNENTGKPTVEIKRGVDTIRKFSILRKDHINQLLVDETSAIAHVECRRQYTKRFNGDATVSIVPRRTSQERVNQPRCFEFDFKRRCLLCAEECGFDSRNAG